jgi:hypothetical protein
MTGPAPAPLFPPELPTSIDDHALSRLADDEMVFFTLRDIAHLTRRKTHTIENLLSRYQLPRRRSYDVRRGHRQTIITVRRDVVRWLVEVVLHGNRKLLERPPSR